MGLELWGLRFCLCFLFEKVFRNKTRGQTPRLSAPAYSQTQPTVFGSAFGELKAMWLAGGERGAQPLALTTDQPRARTQGIQQAKYSSGRWHNSRKGRRRGKLKPTLPRRRVDGHVYGRTYRHLHRHVYRHLHGHVCRSVYMPQACVGTCVQACVQPCA